MTNLLKSRSALSQPTHKNRFLEEFDHAGVLHIQQGHQRVVRERERFIFPSIKTCVFGAEPLGSLNKMMKRQLTLFGRANMIHLLEMSPAHHSHSFR